MNPDRWQQATKPCESLQGHRSAYWLWHGVAIPRWPGHDFVQGLIDKSFSDNMNARRMQYWWAATDLQSEALQMWFDLLSFVLMLSN